MGVRTPAYAPRVTWATLDGKPATFPPEAHTHTWGSITGKPTTFAPSAHTHSYNDLTDKLTIPTVPTAGRLEFIANVAFSETLLLSLAVGMKRRTVAVAGVLATDKLQFALNGTQTAGCEIVNIQQAGNGQVSVGYYTPLLGIGSTYSMPFSCYRITT